MTSTQKPTNPLFTRQALVALLLPLIAEQALSVTIGPVSYTHLRAHETEADLVCRLLLEKKKLNQRQLLLL